MQHEIITLCHSAIVQGNQMSILGAFDDISVETLPHNFPPFALACRLRFDQSEAGDHHLKVTIADTDGRILGQMITTFRLQGFAIPSLGLNVILPIAGMELRCHGEHAIDLILDDQPPLRIPFYVVKKA